MICFAWDGFPQYAARCVGAFVEKTKEKVCVIATRPKVPISGMDRVAKCPIKWIDDDELIDVEDIDVLFVSGWGFPVLNHIANQVRARGGKVVCMIDNCFGALNVFGWLREFCRAIRFRLCWRNKFDAYFVPGKAGRRMLRFYGVKNELIYEGLYSADESLFTCGDLISNRDKKIIYVGQFIERKNVMRLCNAFIEANPGDWSLDLYGSGPLRDKLPNNDCVRVHDFVQPEQLAGLYKSARIFCLPSIEEHWGLVVHEAALSGCLLLLSKGIGAAADLLEGNGYSFNPLICSDIIDAIRNVTSLSSDEQQKMSTKSISLASQRGLSSFVTSVKKMVTI